MGFGYIISVKFLGVTLTRIKGNFTYHDPSGSEVKSQFNKFADTMVQFDSNIMRRLVDIILLVMIGDRFATVIFATDTEQNINLREYLLT